MSNDPFSNAGSGSGASITDFEGRLLLLTPTEYLDGDDKVKTEYGDKDVVVTDLVALDGDEVQEESGVYVFQGKLIGALKRNVGKKPVLGRLGRGTPAKKGQAKPWELQPATEADKQIARDYLARKTEDPFE